MRALFAPPYGSTWVAAVILTTYAPWGHWGPLGWYGARVWVSGCSYDTHKIFQWVVLGQNPSESLTIHPALRHLELQHSSSGLLANLAAGDMCSLPVQGVGGATEGGGGQSPSGNSMVLICGPTPAHSNSSGDLGQPQHTQGAPAIPSIPDTLGRLRRS